MCRAYPELLMAVQQSSTENCKPYRSGYKPSAIYTAGSCEDSRMTEEPLKVLARAIIKICGTGGVLLLIAVTTISGYIMQVDALEFESKPLSWGWIVTAWALGLIAVLYSNFKAIQSSDLARSIMWFAIAFTGACLWFVVLIVLTGMTSII